MCIHIYIYIYIYIHIHIGRQPRRLFPARIGAEDAEPARKGRRPCEQPSRPGCAARPEMIVTNMCIYVCIYIYR